MLWRHPANDVANNVAKKEARPRAPARLMNKTKTMNPSTILRDMQDWDPGATPLERLERLEALEDAPKRRCRRLRLLWKSAASWHLRCGTVLHSGVLCVYDECLSIGDEMPTVVLSLARVLDCRPGDDDLTMCVEMDDGVMHHLRCGWKDSRDRAVAIVTKQADDAFESLLRGIPK